MSINSYQMAYKKGGGRIAPDNKLFFLPWGLSSMFWFPSLRVGNTGREGQPTFCPRRPAKSLATPLRFRAWCKSGIIWHISKHKNLQHVSQEARGQRLQSTRRESSSAPETGEVINWLQRVDPAFRCRSSVKVRVLWRPCRYPWLYLRYFKYIDKG